MKGDVVGPCLQLVFVQYRESQTWFLSKGGIEKELNSPIIFFLYSLNFVRFNIRLFKIKEEKLKLNLLPAQ